MGELDWRAAIWAHGLANVPTFFAEVERAFAFLPEKYSYTLAATESNLQPLGPTDTIDTYVDAQAFVVYLSNDIEVSIVWSFLNATMRVSFAEVMIPGKRPARVFLGKRFRSKSRRRTAYAIRLESLAAVRGHADDPDFLLGDVADVNRQSSHRRFKVLQDNLTAVIAGLAHATERYADDVLRGDTSVFPEVMAYYTELYKRVHPLLYQSFYPHG